MSGLTCPISLCDWVETADLLPARVIFDKGNLARDVDLALFFCHFSLFICDWLGTGSTAVSNDMLSITKEGRVAVKIDLALLFLVPLRVEE